MKKIYLQIPENSELIAAMGEVAIRQGQLDHVLKLTVKITLSISMKEALDATEFMSSSELRRRVRRLVKQRIGEGEALVRLDAILNRAQRATKKRNDLVHKVWAKSASGRPIIKDDEHKFGKVPSVLNIKKIADELAGVATDLNTARLSGFLATAFEDSH